MRLRSLLATAVACTIVVGIAGTSAQAATAPTVAKAGTITAWGNSTSVPEALDVPTDLTSPVADISTNDRAGALVTVDGRLRVWGDVANAEVGLAPTVSNATMVELAMNAGAVLDTSGRVTAWGSSAAFAEGAPTNNVKAIAVTSGGTGYAVATDGTLSTWGVAPMAPVPTGLTNVVDVAAGTFQGLALHADGTVTAWGLEEEGFEGFNSVPDLGGKKVTEIVAGSYSNGVVLEDGTFKTWGPVPVGNEPALTGEKVIDLDLAMAGAAVTEDGTVHTWGADPAVDAIPAALTGQPVSGVEVAYGYAVALTTSFRDLTKPTIAGTAQVGKTLTATAATFSLTPDTPSTGQWFAGAAPITGATGSTLALTSAHLGKAISYRTTATRGTQSVTSASTSTAAVKAAPVPPVPPAPPAPPVKAKAKAKIGLAVKATGKTKKMAKKVTIKISVKATARVNPAGKVTVTFKGKSKKKVTVRINKQGKATVTLKKIKRGSYKTTVSYAGNAQVLKAKATKRSRI